MPAELGGTENFQKRVIRLTNDYDVLKEGCDDVEQKNEAMMQSQERRQAENPTLIAKYEKAINEKDEEIASQKEIINRYNEDENPMHVSLNKLSNIEDMFRMKARKQRGCTRNFHITHQKCEFAECDSSNVDLIKCNLCRKWVCEDCKDTAVGKVNVRHNILYAEVAI